MDDQNKVDMSLDDIIKLNKKEKNQAKKVKMNSGRGRGQARGRGQRQALGRGQRQALGRGQGQLQGIGRGQLRGIGRGTRAMLTGRGRGQRGSPRGAFSGRGRGKDKFNTAGSAQTTNRTSMRGIMLSTTPRGGRGRGRGIAQRNQMGVGPIKRQTSFQTGKNPRGIGRGRVNRGALVNKRNQIVFTNSAKKQQRPQQLFTVKTQATLLLEKEEALKNLQQAKRNMQSINKAIQQTSRDSTVNQKRGINTNETQMGRGRRKLLTGLMTQHALSASTSMPNLSISPDRHMLNTSVTIPNPRAGGNRRRQWRPRNSNSNVVLQVGNRGSHNNAASKPSFQDQLNKLKPTQPTTYKFQKNMFATPSTSLSLNDRFSSHSSSETSLDGRKVFV